MTNKKLKATIKKLRAKLKDAEKRQAELMSFLTEILNHKPLRAYLQEHNWYRPYSNLTPKQHREYRKALRAQQRKNRAALVTVGVRGGAP